MALQTLDLWSLVRGRPQIDPRDLAEAVEAQAGEDSPDYRTRLLIRDSVKALKIFWGEKKFAAWLAQCPCAMKIQAICREAFDEIGFPSLRKRLMDKTDPESIRQYFTQLGHALRQPVQITVGGSCALVLTGYVSRFTEDIDVVDEVPADLRTQYALLEDLEKLHGLHLGHVQAHYFPQGWQERTHAYGIYHHLQVSLVDVYDIFLSKLFSTRLKDFSDLKVLLPQLDKVVLVRRFLATCSKFLTEPRCQEAAAKNWHILFGDDLPS